MNLKGKCWENREKGKFSLYFGEKISFWKKKGGRQKYLISGKYAPLGGGDQTQEKNIKSRVLIALIYTGTPQARKYIELDSLLRHCFSLVKAD